MFPVRSAIAVTATLGVLLLPHTSGAEPQQTPSSWPSFRSSVNQQNLQTVLVSIEERLRGLDTLFSPRYTPRWEVSIEQQTRRLEAVESRLGRLETLIELRLDKIAETLSARQLKEELSRDQVSRKVDSVYERLNHRIGYMEARLDMGIAKLQTNVEAGTGKLERLETTNSGRQGEIEAELVDMGSGIDEIKRQLGNFEEHHNRSLHSLTTNTKQLRVEVEDLMTLIEQLQVAVNKTRTGPHMADTTGQGTNKDKQISEKLIEIIDKHANNFVSKTNNMYNEMWRKMQILEGLVKDSMSLSNATRRELQEGIRSIAIQLGRRGLLQADRERQDGFTDSRSFEMAIDTLSLLQRKLTDLGRKFDSSFQMLMLAQNLFLESCHRIQMDEPQLETKLSKVLEKILDTITNRSSATEREMQELQEILKSHTSQLMRTIGHATSTLVQVSEQSNDDSKHLEATVLTMKDRLNDSNRFVEQAVSGIQEERNAASEKLDSIIVSIQELHDYVTELPGSFGLMKHDEERDETSACPDTEQLAVEFVRELHQQGLVTSTQDIPVLNMTTFIKNFLSEMKKSGIVDIHLNEEDSILVIDDNMVDVFEDETEENVIDQEETKNRHINVNESAGLHTPKEVSVAPQLHRFDIHASKRLTNVTKEEAFTPAQVAIEVFPYARSESYDLPEDGMELTNVAAIIHDTHPNSMTLVQSFLNNNVKPINEPSFPLHNSHSNSNVTHAAEKKDNLTASTIHNSMASQDSDKTVRAPGTSNINSTTAEGWSEIAPTEISSLTSGIAGLNNSENGTLTISLRNSNNISTLTSPHTNSEPISNVNTDDDLLLKRNARNFWSDILGEVNYDSSEDSASFTSTEDRLEGSEHAANLRMIEDLTTMLNRTKNDAYDYHRQYLNKLRDLAADLVSRSEIQRSRASNISVT